MPKSAYILAIENVSSATRCRDIRYECEAFGTVLDVRFFFFLFFLEGLRCRAPLCLTLAPTPHTLTRPHRSSGTSRSAWPWSSSNSEWRRGGASEKGREGGQCWPPVPPFFPFLFQRTPPALSVF